MNGRIYDPALGRFMSADPFVQQPDNLQDYNRYSHVNNNPLMYTDPSGYFKWKKLFKFAAIAAISWGVGAAISGAYMNSVWASTLAETGMSAMSSAQFFAAKMTAGVLGGAAGGFATGVLSGGGFEGGLQGAISGGLFGLAGGVNPLNPNSIERIAAHAGAGCIMGAIGGGGCGRGAASAAAGKIFTNLSDNPIAAVVAGGTASVIGGGKFANGAATAAFGYLFNQAIARNFYSDLARAVGNWFSRPIEEGAAVQVGGGAWTGAVVGIKQDTMFSTDSKGMTCTQFTTCLMVGPFAGAEMYYGAAIQSGINSPGTALWQIGLFGGAAATVGVKGDFLIGADGSTQFAGGKALGGFVGGGIQVCRQHTADKC